MNTARERRLGYLALWAMPFLFNTNVVLGRATVAEVEPFTLAFLRWLIAAAILIVIARGGLAAHWPTFRREWRMLLVLAFLAMWICGGLFYFAMKHTTATNGALIYTTASVMMVVMDRLMNGTPIPAARVLGIVLGISGVLVIVVKGSLDVLVGLSFNIGDLVVALATLAWATYSMILKRPVFQALPTMPMFAAIAIVGVGLLAPFAAAEIAWTGAFPVTASAWWKILGLGTVASVAAFSTYLYGLRIHGPAVAGVFIYLFPPAGVLMAAVFLSERVAPYHIAGFVLILAGIVLATAPVQAIRERIGSVLGPGRAL